MEVSIMGGFWGVEDARYTFTTANDKVLVCTAKCRSDDELLLNVCFKSLDHIASINFHQLDLIWTHAD